MVAQFVSESLEYDADAALAADAIDQADMTDQQFVEAIYTNVLGSAGDSKGISYWLNYLTDPVTPHTRADMVAQFVSESLEYDADAALAADAIDQATYDAALTRQAFITNKADVGIYFAQTLGEYSNVTDNNNPEQDPAYLASIEILSNVTDSADSVTAAKATIDDAVASADPVGAILGETVVPGETFELTSGTDVATANVFNAPMVFVPDGSDRILSLQDEDVLTGTAGRTDNTLNVTMGNRNTDEGTTATTTPILNNIQNINIDWTGNTNTLDLRNADATESVNVKRVTSDATAVTVDNIGTPAADFRVASTASDNVNVFFTFKQGVLTGDEALALELNDVLANSVVQNARGAGAGIEGFEAVNLHAVNGVDLGALSVNEMESLVITGSGALKIAALTPTAVVTTAEYDMLGAPGIANPSAVVVL